MKNGTIGTAVFLSQYMQIARGKSPTESGLLTIPMVVGLFVGFGSHRTRVASDRHG